MIPKAERTYFGRARDAINNSLPDEKLREDLLKIVDELGEEYKRIPADAGINIREEILPCARADIEKRDYRLALDDIALSEEMLNLHKERK